MSQQYAPTLAYCYCGELAVILDVAQDRYFAIAAQQEPNGSRPARQRLEQLTSYSEALAQGTLFTGPQGHNVSGEYPILKKTYLLLLPLMAAALVTDMLYRRRIRRQSFQMVIEREFHRPMSYWPARLQPDLPALRTAFERIGPMVGKDGRCLSRSFAYRLLAKRFGYNVKLVIGVKVDPFAAHCWVEYGSQVANDSLEQVRLFNPILIL